MPLTAEVFCCHSLLTVVPQEKSSTNNPFCPVGMLTFTWSEVHELMTRSPQSPQTHPALLSRLVLSCHLLTRTTCCCYQHLLLKSEPDILQGNEGKGLTHPKALHVTSMTELICLRDKEGSTQATRKSCQKAGICQAVK